MKKFSLDDMKGGWFVGDFNPAAFQNKDVEVGIKYIPKGEVADNHYHKQIHELTVVMSGFIEYKGQSFSKGEMILIEPNERNDMHFVEETTIVIVKWPSITDDKYY